MKASNTLKELIGQTSVLTMRLFETLAEMTAGDKEVNVQLPLNEAKQIEDMLYAINGVAKIEKEYPKDRKDEIDETVTRVTSNLIYTWSEQDKTSLQTLCKKLLSEDNKEVKPCQKKTK